MRDRSLDEFLGDEDDGTPDAADASDEAEVSDTANDRPEPAVSTVAFDPEGAACEACGEMVTRRWRDDGALVCGECKTW